MRSSVHFGPSGLLGSIGSPGFGLFGSFGFSGSTGLIGSTCGLTVTTKLWSTFVSLSKFLSVAVVNPSVTRSYPRALSSASLATVE